jgi:hypothetical protein
MESSLAQDNAREVIAVNSLLPLSKRRRESFVKSLPAPFAEARGGFVARERERLLMS